MRTDGLFGFGMSVTPTASGCSAEKMCKHPMMRTALSEQHLEWKKCAVELVSI